MPATKEAPATEIASGSFADAAGGDDEIEEGSPDTSAANAEQTAADEAATKAAADASTTTTTKKDGVTNPNLDDEPEAVTTTAAANDDEIPAEQLKGMTAGAAAKAKETWKTLKAEARTAAAERDAARAEVAAAKKLAEDAGKTGPEIERLKKEIADRDTRLKEFEGEISLTRIEATPQFKSQVSGPIKSAEDFVRSLATRYELASPAALLDAIRETDPQKRLEALEELSSDFRFGDRTNLFDAAKVHAAASVAGEDMRKEAGTKLEQMTRQEQEELERANTANLTEFRTTAEERFAAMQEQHPLLRHVEGKPEWNAYVDGIKADITGVNVNELPIADVAKAVVSDRILPEIARVANHFQGAYKKEREARIAAEKKLADYRATAPGAGGGRTTEGGPGGAKGGDESFLGAVAGDGD
jgi:hypothetical protein